VTQLEAEGMVSKIQAEANFRIIPGQLRRLRLLSENRY
jgi:hypothetical protein